MKLNSTTRRVAVAATSTALAAGALVGASATSAQAATVTSTYTCGLANLYSGSFPLTVTGDLPVDQYWAGANVPAGLLAVTASAQVPADAAGLLGAAGVDNAVSRDFGFSLGSATASVPISGAFKTEGGVTTWDGSGQNKAFTTPKPGAYDVVLPTSFTITTRQGQTDSAALDCTIADGATPATLDTITLLKQTAKITAPKTVKAKLGKKAVVAVSVTNDMGAAAGKVVAKKGNKTVATGKLNKAGKVKLKIAKLKAGKTKLTVKYAGNASVKGASAKVTVKVTK